LLFSVNQTHAETKEDHPQDGYEVEKVLSPNNLRAKCEKKGPSNGVKHKISEFD